MAIVSSRGYLYMPPNFLSFSYSFLNLVALYGREGFSSARWYGNPWSKIISPVSKDPRLLIK